MVESKANQFAPDHELQNSEAFRQRVNLASECLYNKYSLGHEKDRQKELEKFDHGFAWEGPARFAQPIYLVAKDIPNMQVLQSVEDALCGIVNWPNARAQAFQLKQLIKYGANAGLYEEVAKVGDLVSRIAKEKPYGDKTVGKKLIYVNWDDVYWENGYENGAGMEPRLKGIIGRLTDFADGKYEHCLNDYPLEPFWHLKDYDGVLSKMSPEERSDYTQSTIETYYPTLLEHPDLVKQLGFSIDKSI